MNKDLKQALWEIRLNPFYPFFAWRLLHRYGKGNKMSDRHYEAMNNIQVGFLNKEW